MYLPEGCYLTIVGPMYVTMSSHAVPEPIAQQVPVLAQQTPTPIPQATPGMVPQLQPEMMPQYVPEEMPQYYGDSTRPGYFVSPKKDRGEMIVEEVEDSHKKVREAIETHIMAKEKEEQHKKVREETDKKMKELEEKGIIESPEKKTKM